MFENNHPLHIFVLVTCRITNTTKPNIIIPKGKIIQH